MKIVIWHNLNNDSYYHKLVKGTYIDYEIGYINQYNHKVILVINQVFEYSQKTSFRKKVLTKTISFLQKLNK